MPMLSRGTNAPYSTDAAFIPITTYFDTAVEAKVPDYSLKFIVSDYSATDFAFDRYEGCDQLLPDNKVDKYFLICRYERLFKHKNSPSAYYCVPWMAIPGTEISADHYSLDKETFFIDVDKPHFGLGFPTDSDVHRKLTLRPSNEAIKPTWKSSKTALLDVPNITQFPGDSVKLKIPNGEYPKIGEYVEILDTVDNKIVGKVRIIFLAKLSLKAFPIRIIDETEHFRFDRLSPTDMPDSLEGFEAATIVKHGKIVADANAYGFNHVGFNLDFNSADVKLVGTDKKLMEVPSGSQTLARIEKSSLKMPDDTPLPYPITSDEAYEVLLDAFLTKVDCFQDDSNNKSDQFSKFSRIFVFVTSFQLDDGTVGLTQGFDGEVITTTDTLPRSSPYPAVNKPRSVTLFETGKSLYPTWSVWIAQAKEKKKPVLKHVHEFVTLVHEGSHALFVRHFFPEELKDKDGNVISSFYDLCTAHKWLRLYIKGDYDTEIFSDYDDKKLSIGDFATGIDIDGRIETLFDRIITDGIDKAVKDFIDANAFSVGKRPVSWNSLATEYFSFADLIFWICLNDIVKFSNTNTINNIMDYEAPSLLFDTTSLEAVTYAKQVPVRFNRFQWEVLRKAVKRLRAIEKLTP